MHSMLVSSYQQSERHGLVRLCVYLHHADGQIWRALVLSSYVLYAGYD